MSKLYIEYLKQKKIDNKKIYLFKSGIFYIALDEDAILLSKNLNFKLTNLNETIVKVGFPLSRLDYYTNLLNSLSIPFKIIDNLYKKIDNYSDYLNNNNLKRIIKHILNIDFNNTTFKEAFDELYSIQKQLKEIYNKDVK